MVSFPMFMLQLVGVTFIGCLGFLFLAALAKKVFKK